jgi:glutaconate CoA-transferase subunit A
MTKVISLQDIRPFFHNGCTLAIGGFAFHRHPIALVREVIRMGVKDLTVQGWNNGDDVDLLSAAGLVKRVETSYVGMVMFGLALNYRRGVESGEIYSAEYTEATALDRFRAGAFGIPFMPAKGLFGSDVLTFNPDIKSFNCPITGERLTAIPAAVPDVALIHGHYADEDGNVLMHKRRLKETEADLLIAKSAKRTIVSVERIVSKDYVETHPFDVWLPAHDVDAVIELPFGAHPNGNDLFYETDVDHLTHYVQMSKQKETMDTYLEEYVYQVTTHDDYLNKVLTAAKLTKLQRGVNIIG